MASQDLMERKDSAMRLIETIPTQAYLGAAIASIGLSALMRLFGKKDAAVFFGQWPPTFVLFALAGKLLQPSNEAAFNEARDAANEAGRMVSPSS